MTYEDFPFLRAEVEAGFRMHGVSFRAVEPGFPVSGDLIARYLQEYDTLQEGARTRRCYIHIDIWKAGS